MTPPSTADSPAARTPGLDEAVLDDLTSDVEQVIAELWSRDDGRTAVTVGAFSRRIVTHVAAAVRAATLDEAEQAVEAVSPMRTFGSYDYGPNVRTNCLAAVRALRTEEQ